MDKQATAPNIRLADVIASLALATDLAEGQPLEHSLRRTLLAVWLGEELGLSHQDLSDAYYVALLGSVGCVLDGSVFAAFVKDEIAVREEMVTLDSSQSLRVAAFFLRRAGAGDPPLRRLTKFLSLGRQSQAICRDVALHVGGLLDLGSAIKEALGQCDEHWNGKGHVLGLKGEEIHLAARLFILAQDVEVFNRLGGADVAMTVVRKRAGKIYDPRIAERFSAVGAALLNRLQSESAWDAVLSAEPAPLRLISSAQFDEVACKVANFIDMRSPYTVGHSPMVASLAERAALALGVPAGEAMALRHAGLLHDLGRAGAPVSFWNKTEPLSGEEWERMKRHPSLTEIVLARSSSLGHLGTVAGLHHEKLDGSGYRGLSGTSLPITARILAAADTYQSKLENRPHREAMSAEIAAAALRRQVEQGKLDGDAVEAVLGAAGHQPEVRSGQLPAGLSEREVEVLCLAVRGLTNRQIAEELYLAPKTVGHHLENVYSKIGVSTRVGATLFALQHGLIADSAPA